MNYAEKILRKYGWQKGKGLGRLGDGVSEPLKCNLKMNKTGIGYDKKVSEETKNPWWVQMYDDAASKKSSSSKKTKSGSSVEGMQMAFSDLTDEELFVACGGRTAHKAARHGIKQSGKLERIKKQENMVTAASQISQADVTATVAGPNCTSTENYKRTKKAIPSDLGEGSQPISCQLEDSIVDSVESSSESCTISRKKKKGAKLEGVRGNDVCIPETEDACEIIVSKKSSRKRKRIASQS